MIGPEPDHRWPGGVYDGGTEPDPRFSLANERTFLAWIRTTLGLLGGAVAVHAVDLAIPSGVQRVASTLLALSGLACAVHSWTSWAATEKALRHGRPLPSNAIGVVIVAAVVAVSLITIMIVTGSRG